MADKAGAGAGAGAGADAEAQVRSWGFPHVFTWTDGP